MNVSIATVAKDVGTTVTGIQTAITFYTLVMASLVITGGARIDGLRSSLAVLAVIALIALFTSRRIPARQPSAAPVSETSA